MNESYKPNLNQTIKEAIGNKDIILTNGSLLKLIQKDRTKYIPQIKETLNTPDFIIKDNENIVIFAKRIQEKDFFTSINLERDDFFVSISNAPKKSKTLENKLKAGAEIIYQSPNAKSNTETLLQSNKSLPNEIDEDIIPKIAQKFNKDEAWAKNLFEWHKDSHELTKNADGTPKVFYHGSGADDITIFDKAKDESGLGFWFSGDKDFAENYHQFGGKNYEVFLHIKNPLDFTKPINKDELRRIFGNLAKDSPNLEYQLKKENVSNKDFLPHHNSYFNSYKNFSTRYAQAIKEAGYDGIIATNEANKKDYIVVFDSNQIKAVANKGTFDSSNPNIYHANATLGGGVLGGSIAGLEYDENGNIKGFSPQNFALGFASGALASKGLQNDITKKYAKITSQKIKNNLQSSLENIIKNNQSLILQNPQGFINELDKKRIRELLESKGNVKMSIGDGKDFLAKEIANNTSRLNKAQKEKIKNF
ncbi:ADP-ribosyltransferase-containing protein [Helicobacter sp. T3_23-1056]